MGKELNEKIHTASSMEQKAIEFKDERFEEYIRKELKKEAGQDIYPEDLYSITTMEYEYEIAEDEKLISELYNVEAFYTSGLNERWFKYFPKLKDLSIHFFNEDKWDISFLKENPNIEELFISGGDICDYNLKNIKVLYQLPKLKSLGFHEMGELDFSFLKNIPNLEEVLIGWVHGATNIETVGMLPNLKRLDITCDVLKNLEFLSQISSDVDLCITGCWIKSDAGIDNLQRFEKLDFDDNCIGKKNLHGLF